MTVLLALDGAGAQAVPLREGKLAGQRLQDYLLERYQDFQCLSDSPAASVWKVTLPCEAATGRQAASGGGAHAASPVKRSSRTAQACQVLKVFSPGQQAAFRRETAVSLGLRHPQIVQCLDTFVLPDGHACLVYEFAPEGSLADFCAAARLESAAARQRLAGRAIADVLKGLSCLHGQGYLHCDIKPANVLVSFKPGSPHPVFKLGDLGSAATLKEAQSGRYGVGSPAYCAPERLYSQFGFSSDIYSIGVMAFELLTGHLPFIGEVDEVYRAHLSRGLPLAEVKHASWREWLEQATHKLPRSRFQTALEALSALPAARDQAGPTVATVRAAALPLAPHEPAQALPAQSVQSVLWQDVGTACPAPDHDRLLAGDEGAGIFLATEAGLQHLRFSSAGLTMLTSARAPYALPGAAQGLPQTRLLYCSGGRIIETVPCQPDKMTLAEQTGHPLALAASDQFVAFVEQRRVVVQRRDDASVCLSLRHRHYAMEPLLALGRRTLAMTMGLANNELWIRSINPQTTGDVVARLAVDGPWLGLCSTRQGFMAVCASLDRPDQLTFHVIDEDGAGRHASVTCGALEVAVCAAGFAYLCPDRKLVFMDADFLPATIAGPLQSLQSLALTSDGNMCFASVRAQGVINIFRWSRRAGPDC